MKKLIFIFITLILLIGCSDQITTSTFKIHSAAYLNPDINGRTSPVSVILFDLKKTIKIKKSSYSDLLNNSYKTLDDDLLDKHMLEIRPGHQQIIKWDLSPNTQYIAIVANYRLMRESNWLQIIKVPNKDKAITIIISLDSQRVTARIADE